MPYVTQDRRDRLMSGFPGENAGELNFKITVLINNYCRHKGLKYQTMNDVVGALDSAKAEFQRRVVAPYEDLKIQQNGDVYHESLLSRSDVRTPAI